LGGTDDGHASRGATPRPTPCRFQSAQDVINALQEQVEAVRAEPEAGTLEKARVIGQLASIALQVIEARDIAARLDALEKVLKKRNDNENEESEE
jgi:hypothetical protein